MCVFIDFARLAAALRCCRNVVSIGRQGMLRLAVGMAIAPRGLPRCPRGGGTGDRCRDRPCGQACAQLSDAATAMPAAAVVIRGPVVPAFRHVLQILNQMGTKDGDLIARINDEILRQDAVENLFGFKFGVGLSVTTSRRKGEIKDAVVDSNRVVRVTREQDSSIGYLLEAHYFFVPEPPIPERRRRELGDRARSSAIQAGTGNEKRAVRAGLRPHDRVPAA